MCSWIQCSTTHNCKAAGSIMKSC